MIGVSPAFFIAKYTNRFSVVNMLEGLEIISSIGFKSAQLEVFHHEYPEQWTSGGDDKVRQKIDELGLFPSQFVCHFLLHAFGSVEKLKSDYGIEEMKTVLGFLEKFPECPIVMMPQAAFEIKPLNITSFFCIN